MATIHDVARAAGVSISTVSYALSGKRSIAESTRQRVDDAVRQLDYRPNAGARMLKGTRTNILALSAPLHAGTYAPAHMTFVLSVTTAAREYDYDVLLLTQDEATSGISRVAQSSLVDGIILLDVSNEDARTDLVRTLGLPATVVGIPECRATCRPRPHRDRPARPGAARVQTGVEFSAAIPQRLRSGGRAARCASHFRASR
jgi:DNA-binding LacI/PurR family transcriptional regulator